MWGNHGDMVEDIEHSIELCSGCSIPSILRYASGRRKLDVVGHLFININVDVSNTFLVLG